MIWSLLKDAFEYPDSLLNVILDNWRPLVDPSKPKLGSDGLRLQSAGVFEVLVSSLVLVL